MKKIVLLIFATVICSLAKAQTTYTLNQILDSARQNNIAIRNGRRDIAAASEQRREAFTKYFPTVSGMGGWFDAGKSIVSANLNVLDNPFSINLVKNGVVGGITAVQPVFAGGRIVNGNRLAKVGEETSQLQLRLSQNEVDKTAEQYYWQMVTFEEKLKTINVMQTLLADIHKDVDVSVKAGVAMRNDLLQVELRQNDVESQKLKLDNGLALSRMLLVQFCGLADTAFSLQYSSEATMPLSLKQDHNSALSNTAEYQLLGKQVEAAGIEKKLAVGQYLPSVGIGAGYNYNDVMGSGRSNTLVFATVSIPISDWWGGSHAIKRKKLEYQKAVDNQQNQSELLVIRMQNAWNHVIEAYKQLGIAERSIERSKENLRLNRDFYDAGTSKMSDLLEAQLLYQQALDSRTEAFADYQNRILEYEQAVGH